MLEAVLVKLSFASLTCELRLAFEQMCCQLWCIHSPVARTFFCAQRAHCVLRTLLVTYTHGSSVMKKGVCRMSVLVLYLAFFLLISHPYFAVSERRLSHSLS